MTAQTTPQQAIASHLNMNIGENAHLHRAQYAPRKRTLSTLSNISSRSSKISVQSKADPSVVVTTRLGHQEAYGAFTPTAPASSTLHQFASTSSSHGFFRRSRRPSLIPYDLLYDPTASWSGDTSPTACNSPSSIPSISRASSYISETSSHPNPLGSHRQASESEINPILASLERKSKFCTQRAHCVACGKPGNDFPRCGRCGDMWCSRECRTQGGKRHVCSRTPV